MKKRVITCIFLLLIFSIFANPVWAKYVIEERIDVASIKIDRTAPSLQVSYSTKELTSGNVEVTISTNEIIQEIEEWYLQEDKKTLKKEYSENVKEEIQVKDLSGNASNAIVEINNIDKEAPIIEIQKVLNSNIAYPNYANKDEIEHSNVELNKDLQIKIDNTKPQATYSQEKIE